MDEESSLSPAADYSEWPAEAGSGEEGRGGEGRRERGGGGGGGEKC